MCGAGALARVTGCSATAPIVQENVCRRHFAGEGARATPGRYVAGWQLWYVSLDPDCLRYVAVLQTKDAQVDARSCQAPQKERGRC